MIYKCVNCGGNVVFDPQSGHMKCLSCGGSDCEQSIPSETPMICPSCGSQITYRNEYGSAGKCPACGTFLIRDDFVVYPYGPDMILPFKLSKHLAEEKLKEEFGKKLFLPADFLSTKSKKSATIEERKTKDFPRYIALLTHRVRGFLR